MTLRQREEYIRVICKTHPKANRDGYIYEHTLIAERALGKYMPKGAEVHHFNERKTDNRGANLVVCPDRKYHRLLHIRTDALNASGNPDFRKCPYCKRHDDMANMSFHKSKVSDGFYYHLKCCNEYRYSRGLNRRKNR